MSGVVRLSRCTFSRALRDIARPIRNIGLMCQGPWLQAGIFPLRKIRRSRNRIARGSIFSLM